MRQMPHDRGGAGGLPPAGRHVGQELLDLRLRLPSGFEALEVGALDAALDAVIAEFPDDWAAFCAADDPKKRKKLTGFFTGKVMAATEGRADGRAVGEALTRRVGS